MSLFPSANDFKSGPGVEKDAPRKTGVGRFFELVGRDMSGMFLANLLTCLGFLPVICLVYIGFLMNSLPVMVLSAAVGGILAGPVLAGMYDTVLRALRDEAGYWWTTYRKAFRQNFKASILPGMLYCVVVTVQVFLVYFCFNMLYHGTNVGVGMWVATVLNLIAGLAAAVVVWLFAAPITTWFVDPGETAVIAASVQFLNIEAVFILALGVLFVYRNALQGLGNAVMPLISGGVELAMRLAAAILLSRFLGYVGVCLANPVAWTGAAVMLVPAYLAELRRQQNNALARAR